MDRDAREDEQNLLVPAAGGPLAGHPSGTPEPIALVGLSCRFPKAPDARAFWRLLRDGVDAVGEIPTERFDAAAYFDPRPGRIGKIYSRWAGVLDGADLFDAEFFGIPPREAKHMDPQHRLLLETSWEALEDAGLVPGELAGSAVGVFLGMIANDYEDLHFEDPASFNIYGLTGSFRAAAAGRISTALGLQGPSLVLDTSCSSSLYATHLACQSLWAGESTLALAGGVCLVLQPQHNIGLSHARMLAPDGRCKFGDRRADGFVLGEGVGIVVLKPLSAACADGDTIYALIRGTAANNDGSTGGTMLTTGRQGQVAVMREAWRRAGIAPAAAGYVEAAGVGAPAGDAAEIEAMGAVFGPGRSPRRPLLVGSVKTNMGHTEGAAGIAGVIKTALSLAHGQVPPSLHCREPNPDVAWDDLGVRVNRELAPWPAGDGPRCAGVSATSMSGSNAHVVLEEAPPPEAAADVGASPRNAPQLLALSARKPAALAELAAEWSRFLRADAPASWRDVCRAAARRRTHHEQRLAVVAASAGEAAEALEAFAAGEPRPGTFAGAEGTGKILKGGTGGGATLEALAAAYVAGDVVAWERIYPGPVANIRLPAYPWQHKSFWIDRSRKRRSEDSDSSHPLLGRTLQSAASATQFWQTDVSLRRLPYLRDHLIEGAVVFPAAAILEMALAGAAETFGGGAAAAEQRYGLESFRYDRALVLSETPRRLQLILSTGDPGAPEAVSFELFSQSAEEGDWLRHGGGTLGAQPCAPTPAAGSASWGGALAAVRERCGVEVSRRQLYLTLAQRGWPYGPRFRNVAGLWCGDGEALARLEPAASLAAEAVAYSVHPAWLDAHLQTALAAQLLAGGDSDPEGGGETFVPVAIDSLRRHRPGPSPGLASLGWCQASVRAVAGDGSFTADLLSRDDDGAPVLEIRGLRCRPAAAVPAFFEPLTGAAPVTPRVDRETLAAAPPGERQELAQSYLVDLLARLAGRPEGGQAGNCPESGQTGDCAGAELDLDTPINRQGIESLQAVELRNHLETDLGVKVGMISLLGGKSVAQLARMISQSAGSGAAPPEPPIETGEEAGEAFPLTSMQERFWLRRRADAAAVPSTVPMLFRISGPLEVTALERSLERIVARHEVLRTTFAEGAADSAQRIAPPAPCELPLVDLEALSAGSREAAARRFAVSRCRTPIDLEQGPIFRAMLFRCSAEEHFFFFLIHHIAMDGWSNSLFIHELETLYSAFLYRQPARLPALPVQYRHFARWQRRHGQGEEHVAYWRRQLRGVAASLPFTAGKASPGARSFRAAKETLALPEDLSRRLRELGRSRGKTLFTILLATFKAVLHHVTEQDDVTVGSFFLNRDRAEVTNLIGNFATILPLRSRLSSSESFSLLLERVHTTVLEAQAHPHVLAERFLGEQGNGGNAATCPPSGEPELPLVRVMFMLQNYQHLPGRHLPDRHVPAQGGKRKVAGAGVPERSVLNLTSIPVQTGRIKHDLMVTFNDHDVEVKSLWKFSADLFDAAARADMLAQYRGMLERLVDDPNRPLAELLAPARDLRHPVSELFTKSNSSA